MLIITHRDIVNLSVQPSDCLAWAENVIAWKHDAVLPPKISLQPAGDGSFFNVMPSIVSDENGKKWSGVKVVTRYPERTPALDGKLLLFDAETGEALSLMDADWITAMRTGAVAAHSINLLGKKDYSEIAIMGLGNTARATFLMLRECAGDRMLNVKLLRYKGQEESFVERFANCDNVSFSFVDRTEDLVAGSDVVVSAATYLANDVCSDEYFSEGVLVVPVHTRGFSNCDIFFDKVFADDLGHVRHFKNFDRFNSFAEVSDVVCGRVKGRENDRERILAYNIGISLHDVFFAAKLYEKAISQSLQSVDLLQPVEKFWV